MSRTLIVVGAPDLAELARASLPDHQVIGYTDVTAKPSPAREGLAYLGDDEQVLANPTLAKAEFMVGISDNARRRMVVERLLAGGRTLPVVVHPQSTVFTSAQLAPGTVVCPGSVVSADVQVGLSTMVIYQALLGHETRLGDFCFLAPGAKVLNGVRLENEVWIGANAVVSAGARVATGIRIAAGTVV